MSRGRIYLRNLTANWVGYGVNLLVMFFMSPFVVHQLGDVNYGLWSLMVTFTGYLGLVEIGTRGGVGRFINYYLGRKDIPKLNGIINTAMAIFTVVGGLLILTSTILAGLMPTIFPKIPIELLPSSRIILFLIAGNLWISFFSAPFRLLLTAHERFELVNTVDLCIVILRAGLTVASLLSGYGIVSLAVIQITTSALGMIIAYSLARWVFPSLKLRFSLVSRDRFNELFGFSIWAFIGGLAWRLLYSADNIVIGVLLGPKWVTYYSIGGMLLYRSRELINQSLSIFGPKMEQDCAVKDFKSLRITLRRGSNLAMGTCILLFVGMIVFGKEFILLWMGPKFEISYRILLILTVSSFMAVASQICGPIYTGLNRVKFASLMTLSQGLVNIILTIIFVSGLQWGVEGVAWGTFFPRIIWGIAAGFIAIQWIQQKPGVFLYTVVVRWLLLCVTFWILSMILNKFFWNGGWLYFFLKIAVATGIYVPLAWTFLPNKEERTKIASLFLLRRNRNQENESVSTHVIN